jgi:hypothetical protein
MWAKSQQSGDAVPRPLLVQPARSSPTRNLSLRKSRRVAPSGPVAAGEGFAQIRPEGGRPGRPAVLARQDVESRTPVRSPTRARRAIRIRPRMRPFLSGSPQAWHRGGYPPALASSPMALAQAPWLLLQTPWLLLQTPWLLLRRKTPGQSRQFPRRPPQRPKP